MSVLLHSETTLDNNGPIAAILDCGVYSCEAMLERPRASDPVSLACELDSIEPIGRGQDSTQEEGLVQRLSLHTATLAPQKDQAVAPYQALPLKGPFVRITEHFTPAWDVIEPSDSSEVILRFCMTAPCNFDQAVLEFAYTWLTFASTQVQHQRICEVIDRYKEQLTERTRLHMG